MGEENNQRLTSSGGAMEITETFKASDRAAWRAWLMKRHADAREVWLLLDDRQEVPTVSYLDAVEEALCFGWVDSTAKRACDHTLAQRFSPRRKRSHWTALNIARAQRLIALGLMTDAGAAVLPDLHAPFTLADDIAAALQASPDAWAHFQAFPSLYQRVRVGYVEEGRKDPVAFARRLHNLVQKTAANQMFGNWTDGGRLG
jgi:uncharacterized protein YdeI (YjbR/CyaY-like superfamily)